MEEDAKRILLIDDDLELGAMLGEYLESEGFRVEIVADGLAGMQRAVSGEHDAIVLDIMLPRLNGIELLRQLRVGGKMVIPLGKTDEQILYRFTKISEKEFEKEEFGAYKFVPMLNDTDR